MAGVPMSRNQDQAMLTQTGARLSMRPAAVLGMAAFLANFDVTSVIVALPAIAGALRLDAAGYAWVMDAYSLAFTGTLLLAGALADRCGRRKAMLWGNVVFAVASVACGLAWNGPSLSIARALQGVGAAFVVTGGIALIATTYPHATSRTRAFSWLGVMSGIAMALGPTLGGVVSSWFGWRWIFFANVPACVLIAWVIPRLVAEAREASPRDVDYMGIALLTASLFVLIETLLHARAGHLVLWMGGGLALLLLAVFIAQQRRRAHPIFDPAVFLRPAMAAIAILLAAVSIGYWAVLVYLPLFLFTVFRLNSDQIGMTILAATVPMPLVPPTGAKIAAALGWGRHFALALSIVAAGNAGFVVALLADGGPRGWLVISAMVLIGIGAALAHPQLSGAVVALAPPGQAGMASAVTIVIRQGGFAIGIAAFSALLRFPDRACAYILPFAVTSAACVLAVLAALIFIPPKADRADAR
jgi:MFS family permease